MSLVFLHGFLGHPKDWDGVRAGLTCESQVVTLPGHLHKPMAEDLVLHVHKELGEGPHFLVGYSAGGRLALALKARFPSAYSDVIALSAHPGLVDAGERERRRTKDALWIDKLRKESLENFLEAWYAQPLFTDLKVNLDHRLCHNSVELALFLERFGVGCMPTPQLHPGTLFAYGERDLKYKTLYHTLPSHVQAVAIPAAGHALHIENPEACAKLIKGAIHEHTSISPK